ncbi:helix-turn-helix domain-containing protein [Shimazuella kribbensis]|uniref:helix-turn-helix domain-containing protein n=1 Tax=Shimazuella kribbensis TaxID=139808 RepID=UPI0003F83DC3|nr:helix-turn-helix transcriptional regulator [Shimazuella kribbensis]
MNRKLLGVKLKERRKELGESMDSISDEFISASTVGNIERGLPNVAEEKIRYYAEKIGLGSELFGILSMAEKEEKELETELSSLDEVLSADLDNSMKRLHELSFLNKDSRLSPLYHFLLGRCYFVKRTTSWEKMLYKAQWHYNEVLQLLVKTLEHDSDNLRAATLNELGRIFYYLGNLNEALNCTELGIKAYNETGKRQATMFYLLVNKAMYLERLNEDERALQTLESLWKRISNSNATNILAILRLETFLQIHINFATVLNKVKHYQKALEFAQAGAKIARQNGNYDKLALLWSTTGSILENGNIDEAVQYYLKALSIREKVKKQNIVYALKNLGFLYIKMKRYKESQKIIEEAVGIAEQRKDELTILDTLVAQGTCYREQGLFQDAIPSFKGALNLAIKHKLVKKQYENIVSLCYCYKKINNMESHQYYLEKTFDLQVSMMEWEDTHR